MAEIPYSTAVRLNGDLGKLLAAGQSAAADAKAAAASVSGATTFAAQASAAAADAKLDAIEAATAASDHATTAGSAATIAAGHASDAASSATQATTSATTASTAAASAQTALSGLTNAKGTANGIAPLDASSRLPAASYAIHPGQVLDAAAAAFASITGASVGGFLASQVSDASAGDGTYTAVYVYPMAPPNGRLWGLLSTYLQSLGQSAGAATTTLSAIWTAAASITA